MVCFATNTRLDGGGTKSLEKIFECADSASGSLSLAVVVAAAAAAEELAAAAAANSVALSTRSGLMMQFPDVLFPFLH